MQQSLIDANFPHNFKLELQIRSILDEAWGEIDHFLRYPDHEEDAQLKRQMTVLNGAINGCEELVTTYFKEFQERNIQILPEVKSEIKQMTQRDTSENTKTSKGAESQNLDEKLKNLALYSDTSKYLKNLGIHSEFAKQQAIINEALNGSANVWAKQQAILNEALSGPANVWAKQQAILNEALSGPANIWAKQQAALQNALVGPASTWAKQQAILQNNLVGPTSILAKEQAILEASITESKNTSSDSSSVEEKSKKSKKKKSEDN